MRKVIIFFFTFTLLLSCPALPAGRSFTLSNAQTFDYNKAYQDYQYNYNLYRKSHDNYLSAKNEYLKYQTLAAQEKALQTTREMLKNRSESWRTYLTALRLKLKEVTKVINYDQSFAFIKLDDETMWLDKHANSLSSPTSIEELLGQSLQFEKRFPASELLSYKTLGTTLSAKQNSLRDQTSAQSKKIKDQLDVMKKEGENVEKLENWLVEAEKKIAQSKEKQTQAEAKIKTISENDNDKKETFLEAQALFSESNQTLKEAASFLTEIIREITD